MLFSLSKDFAILNTPIAESNRISARTPGGSCAECKEFMNVQLNTFLRKEL